MLPHVLTSRGESGVGRGTQKGALGPGTRPESDVKQRPSGQSDRQLNRDRDSYEDGKGRHDGVKSKWKVVRLLDCHRLCSDSRAVKEVSLARDKVNNTNRS